MRKRVSVTKVDIELSRELTSAGAGSAKPFGLEVKRFATGQEAMEYRRLLGAAPAMLAELRTFYAAYKDHPERLGNSAALKHHRACWKLLTQLEGAQP